MSQSAAPRTPRPVHRPFARVLSLRVDAVDMRAALARVLRTLSDGPSGYICVAGVHGVMEAHRSPRLAHVYDRALMTIPDGMPLAWVGRLQGHHAMQRVTGPDLMLEAFRRPEFAHVTHFLYGGVEGVAQELRDRLVAQFPWVKIVGATTPPFHDLSSSELDDLSRTLAEAQPDILWIGLGCPKQEFFMARTASVLPARLMIGVGAAFDYHTGRIRDCDEWVKHMGLQWLHRLCQDPRRLWRRYLRNNPAFLWHITLQFLGIVKPPPPAPATAAHPETTPQSIPRTAA